MDRRAPALSQAEIWLELSATAPPPLCCSARNGVAIRTRPRSAGLHLASQRRSLSLEARCAPSLHNRARCRFPASPNDYMVEQQFHRTKKRRHENAIHGDSQGQQGFRGGRPPELETPRRDGEIQRRTDQSWRAARGRRAPCKFEGDAGQVLRREADRDRRAIR